MEMDTAAMISVSLSSIIRLAPRNAPKTIAEIHHVTHPAASAFLIFQVLRVPIKAT